MESENAHLTRPGPALGHAPAVGCRVARCWSWKPTRPGLGSGEEAETDAAGRLVPTDEITNVFVTEKQPGWGAEYPDDKRNGECEYAWSVPDGSRKADAQFDGCFECHMSRAESDYTFTFADYLLETRR